MSAQCPVCKKTDIAGRFTSTRPRRCTAFRSARIGEARRTFAVLWTVKRTFPISALLRSTLIRKVVKRLILWEKKSVTASGDNLTNYPSVPKYRYGEVEDKDQIVIVAPNDERS